MTSWNIRHILNWHWLISTQWHPVHVLNTLYNWVVWRLSLVMQVGVKRSLAMKARRQRRPRTRPVNCRSSFKLLTRTWTAPRRCECWPKLCRSLGTAMRLNHVSTRRDPQIWKLTLYHLTSITHFGGIVVPAPSKSSEKSLAGKLTKSQKGMGGATMGPGGHYSFTLQRWAPSSHGGGTSGGQLI